MLLRLAQPGPQMSHFQRRKKIKKIAERMKPRQHQETNLVLKIHIRAFSPLEKQDIWQLVETEMHTQPGKLQVLVTHCLQKGLRDQQQIEAKMQAVTKILLFGGSTGDAAELHDLSEYAPTSFQLSGLSRRHSSQRGPYDEDPLPGPIPEDVYSPLVVWSYQRPYAFPTCLPCLYEHYLDDLDLESHYTPTCNTPDHAHASVLKPEDD
nr:hypothetical protein BaRGS_023593 [Batillaria attramentaria]